MSEGQTVEYGLHLAPFAVSAICEGNGTKSVNRESHLPSRKKRISVTTLRQLTKGNPCHRQRALIRGSMERTTGWFWQES